MNAVADRARQEFIELVMSLRARGAVTDEELAGELEIERSTLPRLLSGEVDATTLLPSIRELATYGRIDRKRSVSTTYMGGGGRRYSAQFPSSREPEKRADVLQKMLEILDTVVSFEFIEGVRSVVMHVTYSGGMRAEIGRFGAAHLHAELKDLDFDAFAAWCITYLSRYYHRGAPIGGTLRGLELHVSPDHAA